jgi:protein-tyrosine-phosphatase
LKVARCFPGQIDVASAGSTPAAEIHPMPRGALGKLGISMDRQYPKSAAPLKSVSEHSIGLRRSW